MRAEDITTFETDQAELIDLLQERGYEKDAALYADVYSLVASGTGIVGVAAYRKDAHRRDWEPSLRIAARDKFGAPRWSVTARPGMPLSIMLAILDAAEAELSALAGRKVTS